MFYGIWAQVAKQGYFLNVETVRGEEVTLSLRKEPKVNLTTADFAE